MKAKLEFNLPEEAPEHRYALAGTDALLLIEDVLNEIRSQLKHGSGYFGAWKNEEGKECAADDDTLIRVREYICEMKRERGLPDLI